jgi:hypothetical protein
MITNIRLSLAEINSLFAKVIYEDERRFNKFVNLAEFQSKALTLDMVKNGQKASQSPH